MADHLLLEFVERLVDSLKKVRRFPSDCNVDHAPIVLASLSYHQFLLLQPIDQSRNCGNDLNHPIGDFQRRKRLAFSAENPKYVVLRRGEPEAAEKAAESIIDPVTRPEDVQHRFLLRRVERKSFLEFVLEFCAGHHRLAPSAI